MEVMVGGKVVLCARIAGEPRTNRVSCLTVFAAKVPRFIVLSLRPLPNQNSAYPPNEVSRHMRALCGVRICREGEC